MPAVLIEAGFISHPKERAALTSSKHQRKLARAIADGIIHHLDMKKKDGT